MRIHIVQHEAFESPGAYEIWAKNRNHRITWSRVWAGDKLLEAADGIDFLIVMGGPQSPGTTMEECPYFDAAAEERLISSCIRAGKMVIGVCLGAQLLGEALGAPYAHGPEMEVGSIELTLTKEGKWDPFLGSLPEKFYCGQWHNDMPGLTNDCRILAISQGCPRQIIRYGAYVYGFQCHMEFTTEAVTGLIQYSGDDLKGAGEKRFVQTKEEILSKDYAEMNAYLYQFLDRISDAFLRER